MKVVEDLVSEDQKEYDDLRSLREIVTMANSICPILQLEGDCPSANEDKKLSILDLKCWVQDERVYYEH